MKSKMLSDSGETCRSVIREPVKAALENLSKKHTFLEELRLDLLADEMSVLLLLVSQGLEVRLDHEIDCTWGRIRKEVLEILGIHGEMSLYDCKPVEG